MVRRIINLLNKDFGGLHEAAYLLGAFALVSQILALFRDRLLANSFGAGEELDIYYAAFRIPDFIYIAIASFVSITVLVPFLVERLGREKNASYNVNSFINSVLTAFFVIIILFGAIAFFFIPQLSYVIAPGFSDAAREQFVNLSRILLLSPILLGLSSLLGSITQSIKKFFVYAIGPVLYNAGIIAGVVFLRPELGLYGVVLGVIIGAALHLVIQLPVIIKNGLLPKFSLNIDYGAIKEVLILSLPRTVTLSMGHLAMIFLISMASLMGKGAISIFNFSLNLQSVPLSIIGVSYSVAAFPTLASLFSNGENKKFAEHIAIAIRHVIFWSMPAVVLFIVLRAQIVRSVLGSGAFDWSDTKLTAAALALFSVSLIAQSLNLLFVRGYYASGNTKKPFIINLISISFIVLSAIILTQVFQRVEYFRYFMESLLRIDDTERSAVIMLPLAYSLGMILNSLMFWFSFKKDFEDFSYSIKMAFLNNFSAWVIGGFAAYGILNLLDGVLNLNTFLGIFTQGAVAGLVGIFVGIFVLVMVGDREVEEARKYLHHKFWRARVIAPDSESL